MTERAPIKAKVCIETRDMCNISDSRCEAKRVSRFFCTEVTTKDPTAGVGAQVGTYKGLFLVNDVE